MGKYCFSEGNLPLLLVIDNEEIYSAFDLTMHLNGGDAKSGLHTQKTIAAVSITCGCGMAGTSGVEVTELQMRRKCSI